jgi:hypothetical protein
VVVPHYRTKVNKEAVAKAREAAAKACGVHDALGCQAEIDRILESQMYAQINENPKNALAFWLNITVEFSENRFGLTELSGLANFMENYKIEYDDQGRPYFYHTNGRQANSIDPHYRTKVRDFRPGRDSWCVIAMSEHGLGPESLEVKLENMKGQTHAWGQGERDV